MHARDPHDCVRGAVCRAATRDARQPDQPTPCESGKFPIHHVCSMSMLQVYHMYMDMYTKMYTCMYMHMHMALYPGRE